jgi:two-component system, chemotaxis family, chemotaxis protein CheY
VKHPGYVLLVEDDVDLHDSLKGCLELEGHEVVSAFDGRRALEVVRSPSPPKRIILDLMMPVMNGYEFLEILSRDGLLSRIPIVVLSAAADGNPVAEKYGVKFIAKPPSLSLLYEFCATG